MDIRAVPGKIETYDADAIIVNIFQEAEPGGAAADVDAALNGAIRELIEGGDFSGKVGQVAVLYPRGEIPARRVILVGLGEPESFTVDTVRRAAAVAILKARELKADRVASLVHGSGAGGLAVEVAAQAVAEASLLALYSYRGQRNGETPEAFPKSLDLVIYDEHDTHADEGIRVGVSIAAGVTLARGLVNLPPNICTPTYLAETARAIAEENNLRIDVLDRKKMEALKMGALLGVAQGTDTPPQFIILEYNAGRY